MMRMILVRATLALFTTLLVALSLACAGGSNGDAVEVAEAPQGPFAALEPGWNRFEPGGETACSDGSPFHFFARPGDPEKLLVYFQGGGGCWTGATCDRDLEPTYSTTAIAELIEAKAGEPRPERAMSGIFDFTRDDNPVRDYSMVFVPYCTGDVHIGNTTATYEAPSTDEHDAHQVTVEHKGYVNAKAALAWTFDAFAQPSTVFVTGSSAGSIPSPFYAAVVKDQYPQARVVALGDGAGGYRRVAGSAMPHQQWNTLEALAGDLPAFADMAPEDFNYEKLYIVTGTMHPEVQLAAYDAAEDEVQKRFLQISGADAQELLPLLDANRADVQAEVPGFVSFTAGGDSHTILGRDFFYSFRVGEVTFRDWFAALVAGEALDSVHCSQSAAGCSEAETASMATASGGG